MTRSFQNSHQ